MLNLLFEFVTSPAVPVGTVLVLCLVVAWLKSRRVRYKTPTCEIEASSAREALRLIRGVRAGEDSCARHRNPSD